MPPTTRKRKKDISETSNTDSCTPSSTSKRSKKEVTTETDEESTNKATVTWKVEATHEKEITVRTETDTRTCYISSSVLLFGDRLVAADFHNEKCKLINTVSNEVLSELQLRDWVEEAAEGPAGFWDLTAVSCKEVAATVPNRKEIVVLKVGKRELRVDRRIPVKGRCRGIVYRDPHFFVTFDDPVKFETITKEGEVLTTADWTRSAMKTPDRFTLLQPYGQQMCVSDFKTNCVALVTVKGTVKNKFIDFSTYSARGLCLGLGGFVFVCDSKGNKIHVLTGDLSQKIASLSVKGVKEPVSVTFCEPTKQLYVGMDGDTMAVVKLRCTKIMK